MIRDFDRRPLWTKPLHRKLRDQKIDLLLKSVRIPSGVRLLDVGGGCGVDGEFLRLYSEFAKVVVANMDLSALKVLNGTVLERVIADGCSLPFGSASFEWVFSNAVIEHVGDWQKQKQFADEVRRVAARGYFVTTPNKFFPIEPHTLFPFFQFLPPRQQRSFVRFATGSTKEAYPINLLSARDLQILFPEACVQKIGFPILPNSLVAMHMGES